MTTAHPALVHQNPRCRAYRRSAR